MGLSNSTDKPDIVHPTTANANTNAASESGLRRSRGNSASSTDIALPFASQLPSHNITRRRVLLPDACRSSQELNTSTIASSSNQYHSREFLTPVATDRAAQDYHDTDVEGEVRRRVPKKCASTPVLCVPTSAPTAPSPFTDSATHTHTRSRSSRSNSDSSDSPEPPPYTSLPPPLMPMAMPIPVPVPVPVALHNPESVHPSRRNSNSEEDMEGTVERNGEGDGVTNTSWIEAGSGSGVGGVRMSNSRNIQATNHPPPLPPRTGHTLSHSLSTPSRSQSPLLTHSHPAHVPYPGTSKPKTGGNMSLRRRIFAVASGISLKRDGGGERMEGDEGATETEGESEWEREGKVICTTPGMVCAGETETETDEPSRHLPTARVSPTSSRLSHALSFSQPSSFATLPWQWLLFEFSRLLAIVPASLGFIWCLWHIYAYVPELNPRVVKVGRPPPDRTDYIVASLWALLTAHQCLSLTTGLLTRWRHYYTPLSTLVRLLALQGICWPATHLTVNILEAGKRPAVVWAVIGTTTCMSRSIQIWVVSNLPVNSASSQGLTGGAIDAREREKERERRRTLETEGGKSAFRGYGYVYWRKWNKWRRRRRWDWREVSMKCVLPAGVLYFVMAWAGEIRRELGGC